MKSLSTNQERIGRTAIALSISVVLFVTDAQAQLDTEDHQTQKLNQESPIRGIQRQYNQSTKSKPRRDNYRTIDGSGNNMSAPDMNAASSPLKRRMLSDYSDYVYQMGGLDRPGPREISNAVSAQSQSVPNSRGASDFLWQWGQFLDHDIDLTGGAFPAELAPVPIPAGDLHFDPDGTGGHFLDFNRSIYDPQSGTGADNPRNQLNEISGWIDASNVYGSDDARAAALRTNDGTGRLKMSPGRLLPFNNENLPNAGGNSDSLFIAGDVRANEQVGLTAMHTLFAREHNRLARKIRKERPSVSGNEVYERARRIVGAQMQVITYREFIPTLLGEQALGPYRGYDQSVDARIMNEFSTGAFRLGHSLLNSTILRLNKRGREINAGHLPLRNGFFAPQEIVDHGISPILRGLASQASQNLDIYVVDDVRNFLFGQPGHGGFDLASLNIQRGRDHGLPSYNDSRELMGLGRATSFADISRVEEVQSRLASVYSDVDEVDLWVGGLSEDHMPGAMVGELFFYILKEQFEALRDGDRFWYQRSLSRSELRQVKNTRLADIIRRNTNIGRELSRDVFHVN